MQVPGKAPAFLIALLVIPGGCRDNTRAKWDMRHLPFFVPKYLYCTQLPWHAHLPRTGQTNWFILGWCAVLHTKNSRFTSVQRIAGNMLWAWKSPDPETFQQKGTPQCRFCIQQHSLFTCLFARIWPGQFMLELNWGDRYYKRRQRAGEYVRMQNISCGRRRDRY